MRVAVLAAACVAAICGCASIGTPPGGPQRTTPPEILSISPESGAVNARPENVVFQFDAVVSDRAAGGELGSAFLVSPGGGRPRVRWHRDRIEVRPDGGFLPNTAYIVTMLPGISDLRGNAIMTQRTTVFSTGPTIPTIFVQGRVFDWLNSRPAPNARVELIRHADSLPFTTLADSTGAFTIGPIDTGTYSLVSFIDANRDRERAEGESWDSVDVRVGGSPLFAELLAAPRDTVAPTLTVVSALDSLTLEAVFDRPLDPRVPLVPESFRVVAADSSPLRILGVMGSTQAAALRSRQDSLSRLDSIARAEAAARGDSVMPPSRAAAPPSAGRASPLQPPIPPPARQFLIALDSLTPLRPGVYRVEARNARGLLGSAKSSARDVSVPVMAPRDSARTLPAARPR